MSSFTIFLYIVVYILSLILTSYALVGNLNCIALHCIELLVKVSSVTCIVSLVACM